MQHPSPTTLFSDCCNECFVLLDDAQATTKSSRLYTQLIEELECHSKDEWDTTWQATETALQQGYYAIALLQYETGVQIQDIQAISPKKQKPSRILFFKKCDYLNTEEVQHWLKHAAQNSVAGTRSLHASVDQAQFVDAIQKIREYISAGDTYQVNYTYRLHFETYGSPTALYAAIRNRQPVPYGALIQLSNGEAILSFSPELFVKHQQGTLLARPMKGTAAASGNAAEDAQRAHRLSQDSKNRAENLMIVDLLRNDLGRIAEVGSVKVPRLFEVNRFSSVLQMTSTIEAKVRAELNLASIMRSLFPCGSITGAPKKRTMEIIDEIETENRGIYTGAIGWFDPPKNNRVIPDFCLSVPIRTLELDAPKVNGERHGRMGVGAGIVHDSEASDEFAECQLKARFLTGLKPSFFLFETMRARRQEGCHDFELHLARLQKSASYFGFVFHHQKIKDAVFEHCSQFPDEQFYRCKLSLHYDGAIEIQSALLPPLKLSDGFVGFIFDQEQCSIPSLFLEHKSSVREQYDAAWQKAERSGAFDAIFVNQAGNVTEGGRSSVFVKLDGHWFTPPISDGVLPGIMRQNLLKDLTWQAQERSISVAEFLRAEDIVLTNSLRGVMRARRV